jgi:DNA-binding MarR family transcriptional regulator
MAPRALPDGSPLGLDRIVHGPLRLGIVAALATAERRSFTELRDALGATDGNLNASLQKLEQAGYIAATRTMEGRVSRTDYQLTRAGRKALAQYIAQLDRLLEPVRNLPESWSSGQSAIGDRPSSSDA